MEIIIIEDDQSIRENLQEILETYDYTVRSFPDGAQGLKAIQEQVPDLVVCDIMTPFMDGFEVLKNLKSKQETANIPFIFLTAKVERSDQRRGMEMGADDYIVKPFTSGEILNAIDIRLKKQKNTAHKIQDELFNKLNALAKINSHEYNTPLNGIIGLSTALEESVDRLSKAEIVEIAQAVKSSAKRLHRTFKNFILYVLLQKGELSSQEMEVDGEWINHYVSTTLSAKALKFNRSNQIKFHSEINGNLSMQVPSDYLCYVIEELIWNALKFSASGTEVSVGIAGGTNGVKITISNATPNTSFFEKVEPFKQFDREIQEQQGSGLGLYLSKKIAEIYGWQIQTNRQAGQISISLMINT